MKFNLLGKEFQQFFVGHTSWRELLIEAKDDVCRIRIYGQGYIAERILDAHIIEEGSRLFSQGSAIYNTLANVKRGDLIEIDTPNDMTLMMRIRDSKRRILCENRAVPLDTSDERKIGTIYSVEQINNLFTMISKAPSTRNNGIYEILLYQSKDAFNLLGVTNIAVGCVSGIRGEQWGAVTAIAVPRCKLPKHWSLADVYLNRHFVIFEYEMERYYIPRMKSPSVSVDAMIALVNSLDKGDRTIVSVDNATLRTALKMAKSYTPKKNQYAHLTYNPDIDEFGLFTDYNEGYQIDWNGQPCTCDEWGVIDDIELRIDDTIRILDALKENVRIAYNAEKIAKFSDNEISYIIIGKIA